MREAKKHLQEAQKSLREAVKEKYCSEKRDERIAEAYNSILKIRKKFKKVDYKADLTREFIHSHNWVCDAVYLKKLLPTHVIPALSSPRRRGPMMPEPSPLY